MAIGLRVFTRGKEPFAIASNPASVKEEGVALLLKTWEWCFHLHDVRN